MKCHQKRKPRAAVLHPFSCSGEIPAIQMKGFHYFIQSLLRNRNDALKVLTTASSHIRPYSHLNHPVIHSMLL
jgi:hypothetical protein